MRLESFLDSVCAGQYEANGELGDYEVRVRRSLFPVDRDPEIVTDHAAKVIWI